MSTFAGPAALSADTPIPASARATVQAVTAGARRRAVTVTIGLAVAVLVGLSLEVAIGDYPIRPWEVPALLVGAGDPESRHIMQALRLPRALVGVLVGAAFGISGAVFQTMARNALASPDIIGITTGASVAAVGSLLVAGGLSVTGVSIGALLGACAMAAAIFLLAYRRGVSMTRLILMGIGLQLAGSSYMTFLLAGVKDTRTLQRAEVWLAGTLSSRTWEQVRLVAVAMLVLVPVALLLQRSLRALQLGDEAAVGIGVGVTRARFWLLGAGTGLAAFGVAGAGPITLVAFIAPAIGRWLCRSGRPLLLPAALAGAALVLFADWLARWVLGDLPLPVGVVTGLLGGPYFLWLLIRSDRAGG